MEIKKNQLQKLNNLVFKIAKTQNDIEYRAIMKYSKFLSELDKEFNEDIENIRLKFADKIVEGVNPNTGAKYEYNIVSANNEKDYVKAIRELADEKISIDSTLPGYNLFLREISKLSKEEIIKNRTDANGNILGAEYDYETQLIIDELRDVEIK